jgi:hypothetical protein
MANSGRAGYRRTDDTVKTEDARPRQDRLFKSTTRISFLFDGCCQLTFKSAARCLAWISSQQCVIPSQFHFTILTREKEVLSDFGQSGAVQRFILFFEMGCD